jgi:hypothetical protein
MEHPHQRIVTVTSALAPLPPAGPYPALGSIKPSGAYGVALSVEHARAIFALTLTDICWVLCVREPECRRVTSLADAERFFEEV